MMISSELDLENFIPQITGDQILYSCCTRILASSPFLSLANPISMTLFRRIPMFGK